jgi:hypothetical protein
MEVIVLGTIWILACALVGLVGSRRSMGFWGAFLLSLVLTPVVMILVLQLTKTPASVRRDRDRTSSRAS